jgi:hypothetical protein
MKFNLVLDAQENFWFQNYDVVPTLLLWEKEWEAECLLALYSFICNDGFIE